MRTSVTLPLRAALVAVLVIAAGCGKSGQSDSASVTYITIKGSDTMVHLVSAWAEEYMKLHPSVEISVTGGGSGTGVAALLNGTTDICASSRTINEKETSLAAQKNMTLAQFDVALDGIAIVVNNANPLTELTMEQLRKIYTGATTTWKSLNGSDEKIFALSRESNSGTYVFFQEHVLNKQNFAASTRLMPASSAIIQAVESDVTSIGYVGLGYAHEEAGKLKVLPIKADADSPAVMPTEGTVKDGSYSIARPLHLYTSNAPQGAVKEFIDFCLSDAGQEIVRSTGYISAK